jgi:hypothetical protein
MVIFPAKAGREDAENTEAGKLGRTAACGELRSLV